MTLSLLDRSREVLTSAEGGPAQPSIHYQRMALGWKLANDLLGGTERMREAATDWLPQEDRERQPAYNARLNKSVLHPMFEDTVGKLSEPPFIRPVTLVLPDADNDVDQLEKLDARLRALRTNADRDGTDLTRFAQDVFERGVSHGLHFVFVDTTARGGVTLGEEQREAMGPFFVSINAEDFVGYDVEIDERGNERLSEVRFREVRTQQQTHGDSATKKWEQSTIEYIRVVRRGTWLLYRRDTVKAGGTPEWVQVGEGTWNYPGNAEPDIPLHCYYTNRRGRFYAVPPLIGLAWLNVAHWQSYSEHRNHMRFIRVGLMYGTGVSKEEQDAYGTVVVGANRMLWFKNPDAKVEHAAYQGSATEASRLDLKDMEDRAEVLGLQPLVEKGVAATATRSMQDREKSSSSMKQWGRDLGRFLTQLFQTAAKWIGQDLPDNFEVRVFTDFSIAFANVQELDALLKARMAGEISRELYLLEIQRRGQISADVNVRDEMDRLETEAETAFKREQERFEVQDANAEPEDGDEGDDG